MSALQQVQAAEVLATPDRHAGRNTTLLLISTLTIMAGATISPSLPAIESHFAGSPNVEILTRLVLTLPALSIVICAPFAGGLADRFGRQRMAGVKGLAVDEHAVGTQHVERRPCARDLDGGQIGSHRSGPRLSTARCSAANTRRR